MKIISFCKSTKGGTITIAVALIAVYIIAELAFGKNDKPVKEAIQFVSEPLETIYHGTLSKISSSKDKPDDIEDSKETEKKDLKPESTEKPKANPPEQKPDNKSKNNKSNNKQWYNRQIIFRNPPVKPYVPPIGLYTAKPSSIPPNPNTQSAPYGQLLRCELTQTCMTSNLKTPIIAMVTEPLWWNGKEIIPAGVIVHGVAASSPMRDRVGTGKKWVLVWPHRNEWNGKKLVLNAIALACDRTENAWSKIDGSAGIKGDVISNENQKRIYAYMASFISGLGEGMVSENEDITVGTTTKTTGGTFNDALGKAFQQSASDISDQLFKELSQNMFYVEARAGTEFYLYI
ncbi:MAG: TrbI/VirB10 family protein, partial [Victivallaceae bacterium]|nr:TrbI/VirB10 family protein [Victivallaceae bacterium]